eukprot:1161418-Pelagomonas_calceolata.AAC.4
MQAQSACSAAAPRACIKSMQGQHILFAAEPPPGHQKQANIACPSCPCKRTLACSAAVTPCASWPGFRPMPKQCCTPIPYRHGCPPCGTWSLPRTSMLYLWDAACTTSMLCYMNDQRAVNMLLPTFSMDWMLMPSPWITPQPLMTLKPRVLVVQPNTFSAASSACAAKQRWERDGWKQLCSPGYWWCSQTPFRPPPAPAQRSNKWERDGST